MQKTNFIGAILSLIFIVGVAAGVNFAQADSKNWNQKLRVDVGQLTRQVKQSERGAYLVRFAANREKNGILFTPQKTLWTKLSEAEKIAVAEDWWRRWRAIRGATDTRIGFMQSGEEIFCILDRCYVPECAL